ncbi:uncharacterized protein LOC121822864 isoform X2 [Peromyscus maniculatus bairdii]|uniref:uncharacterized protein LOC121822864 isoform X2 n=1 Tax=Peromyscus maniculatus bairdii TaxID=230844 RepID=UPI003FD696DA
MWPISSSGARSQKFLLRSFHLEESQAFSQDRNSREGVRRKNSLACTPALSLFFPPRMFFKAKDQCLPCSAIIGEASFCTGWGQIQRPTERPYAERETLEHSALNGMFSIKFLPSELWEPHRRGARKSVRARRDGGHQENKTLYITMIKVHRI